MTTKSNDLIMQNKIFMWIGIVTAFVLSVPILAMQFSQEVDWKLFDFVVMGTILFGMGSIFVLFARVIPRNYRIITGIAFLAALFLIWAHLAVGIVDSWPLAGS